LDVGEMTKDGSVLIVEPVSLDQLEKGRARPPLLPVRYETDLFIADVFDGIAKGDMPSMEYPIFSLSTKPDLAIRRYEGKDGRFVEITPSQKGLATVHDRDLLIYVMSQLVAAHNDNKPLSKTIRFTAHDMLRFTNRVTSGEGYSGLKQALERLRGTTITTNIKTGGEETFAVFGLIDKATVVSETRDGRMREVEVTLSDWMYRSVQSFEVLTLHKDYFRLRKPLERRIYELARKHCGAKSVWQISLKLLQEKVGSSSTSREFKRLVKVIVEQDEQFSHMPDYAVRLTVDDKVEFLNRRVPVEKMMLSHDSRAVTTGDVRLDTDTFQRARLAAPGWDIYFLEVKWRSWMAEGDIDPPRDPDKAFIGYCRKHFERNGPPA
jgi:plasmid replication initiation protein